MVRVLSAIILFFVFASPQDEDARRAIARRDYIRAVEIVSTVTDENATPDTYLYRGIAYANLKEYRGALESFRRGFQKYPDDPRFHPTQVRWNFRSGDIEQAKEQIRQALATNRDDPLASDLLAQLEISEGNAVAALRCGAPDPQTPFCESQLAGRNLPGRRQGV
jgi:tetratricopeptide (TPR) repeat protein